MAEKTQGLDLTELTKLLSSNISELAWDPDYETCKRFSDILATAFQDHTTGPVAPERAPAPVGRFFFSTTSPLTYVVFDKWKSMNQLTSEHRYDEDPPVNEQWQRKDVLWYPLDSLDFANGTWLSFYYMVNRAVNHSCFYIIREGGPGVAKLANNFTITSLKEVLRSLEACLESGTCKKQLLAVFDMIDEIWTMANTSVLEIPVTSTNKKAAVS